MDESVRPIGYTPWGGTRPTIANTTFYAEYDTYGKLHGTSPVTATDIILQRSRLERERASII
jgi:hypothetical protein